MEAFMVLVGKRKSKNKKCDWHSLNSYTYFADRHRGDEDTGSLQTLLDAQLREGSGTISLCRCDLAWNFRVLSPNILASKIFLLMSLLFRTVATRFKISAIFEGFMVEFTRARVGIGAMIDCCDTTRQGTSLSSATEGGRRRAPIFSSM